MKTTILILVLLAVVPTIVSAQSEEETQYIGIFADPDHSICEVFSTGPFTPFEYYVWILPGQYGVRWIGFTIVHPSNIIRETETANPDLDFTYTGALDETGIEYTFTNCEENWIWTHKMTCYLLNETPSQIGFAPHPGYPQGWDGSGHACPDWLHLSPVRVLSDLHLNENCAIGVNDESWGAIKALFSAHTR